MKFGLKNIRQLLTALGNPHDRFPSVHVAGTNGKGSTAAMIAAMLTASGYKTGLYTSPHLVNFTERIRINGTCVTEEEVVRYTTMMRRKIEEINATFFEATTALAFQYFADQSVEMAVIETGLGGRLDATNVLHPLLSIITSIGLEHTEYLGNSVETISKEKAGIIKERTPCLVGKVGKKELLVISEIARHRHAPLDYVPRSARVEIISRSFGELCLSYRSKHSVYDELCCSMAGDFQENNAAVALAAIDYLRLFGFSKLTKRAVVDGMGHIQRYSGIRGRLDVVSRHPLVIADVAHNPDAIEALVRTLRQLVCKRIVVVFGAMKDKDIAGMVSRLVPVSRLALAVAPATSRAAEPHSIAEVFHSHKARCFVAGSVGEGLKFAKSQRSSSEIILVTGSHFVVGELFREIGKGGRT